jgi:adenosylcobinamide-GDP ribazoletransferase
VKDAGGGRDAGLCAPPVRAMRAAFVFLSRIPLGGHPYRNEDWRWAPAHFPLVGIVIGGATAGVYVGARELGTLVAAALAVFASVLLTGAFHEDGLADSADALGGATDRERVHEILKDSRIGSYGAVAVVGSLLLRVLLIAELDPTWALVVMACTARAGAVWLMAALPYVSGAGGKRANLGRPGWQQAAVATGWVLGLGAALGTAGCVTLSQMGVVLLSVGVLTLILGRWFRARAGGVTGDFLGAAEQAGEVVVLLAWLVLERA